MLPPPPAPIQPSFSRSSKGPRSGQEQMSRAAGPHVRTYPPRRRHRSPGAVSSTPTADPFVHPGASTTAYVASARSPPRAVAPSHPDGAPSPRRLSFCPDARRPSAANFRCFSLSSSSPGRITSRCMYVHDGGARWRAAPGGCPDLRPAAASLTDRSMRQRCGATRHRHPAGRGRTRSPAFPVHASVCPRRHMLRSVLRLVKRKTKNHLGTKQKRMFRMNVELVLFI